MSIPKICIAGKNNIAVDVLEHILKSGLYREDEVVVTCNRTENGKNNWQKSLRYFARKWQVREVSLEDIYTFKNIFFLSLEYDRIIKPELFKTDNLYNVHFSALPKYRGCYTSVMPILNREKNTGVTFHRIDSGIDTGNIVEQVIFPISEHDTSRDLYIKYLSYGTGLAIKMLYEFRQNGVLLANIPQNSRQASYYARNSIDFSQIQIDTQKTAADICAQLRAYSFREYQLPKIQGNSVVWGEYTQSRSLEKPGKIIWKDEMRAIMSTIDYDVVIYWDKFDEVMNAVSDGNMDFLQKIPCLRCYVNQSDKQGRTPISEAENNGYYDIFMLLIASGGGVYSGSTFC